MHLPGAIRKLDYGWWVVLACATLIIYFSGTYFYGFTAFFNPIVDEFGWPYALVALATSLQAFESGLISPIVGILVDKVGVKKMLLCSTVIMAFSLFIFSHVQSLWSFYTATVLLAIAASFSYPVTMMTAVAKWCRKRISLGMGILTAGHAAGGLIVPAIVWLIYQAGWRGALTTIAAGALVLGIPLILLVVKEPPKEPDQVSREGQALTPESRWTTVKKAAGTKDFWLLGFAALFGRMAVTAVIVHQIPYMVSIGVPRTTAGLVATAFAFSNIAGRLSVGFVADFIDKRYMMAASSSVVAAGVFALATSNSVPQLIPSMIALGLGFGGLTQVSSLQADLFGTKAYGTIQGFIMMILTVGNVLAPPLAGRVYDILGNYRPAFMALGASSLIAVPLFLLIRKTKNPYR